MSSSILDSSLVLNEEQLNNGVGVAQPTFIVIHKEYGWELEHQHSVEDGSLPSEPPPFFPRFFGEPAIHDFPCVSLSTDAPIVGHSQNSPDVIPSFNNKHDKLFIEDPLDPSSILSRNIEDEFIRFSSTPLFDSSDHEDAEEFIDFFIVVVVIHLLPILITIMNLSQLIFRSHRYMMIYLMMKLRHLGMSRHFS